jgi:hypothetical protein
MNTSPNMGSAALPVNQQPIRAGRVSRLWSSLKYAVSGINPRLSFFLAIALVWTVGWLNELPFLTKSSDNYVWMFAFGLALIVVSGVLIFLIYTRHKNPGEVFELVLPHTFYGLVVTLILAMMIDAGSPHWAKAGVVIVSSAVWLLVTLTKSWWWVELKPGYVFFHQRYMAEETDIHLVVRQEPMIDTALIVRLIDLGITRDMLRLYMSWGAPRFLRDELSAALLTLYYRRLSDLVARHPQFLKPLHFTIDTQDISYTQSRITNALKAYGVELDRMAQQLRQQKAEATRGQQASINAQINELEKARSERSAIYNRYCQDAVEVHRLFEQSDDPHRQPIPFYRIHPLDHWRLLWRKTKPVDVQIFVTDLMTLDNLPFQAVITCSCTFEPEKVTVPGLRLAFRSMRGPDQMRDFLVDSVSKFVRREAHTYFQGLRRKEALESGLTKFREYLPQAYNTSQAMMHIHMSPLSVDCTMEPVQPITDTRHDEIRDERDLARLNSMLQLSGMDDKMRAETLMRVMMLQHMPSGMHQLTGEVFQAYKPEPKPLPDSPVPMTLPAGASYNVFLQPPPEEDIPSEPVPSERPSVLISRTEVPPHAEKPRYTRRRKRNNIDRNVIDVHPDEDDPDVYR